MRLTPDSKSKRRKLTGVPRPCPGPFDPVPPPWQLVPMPPRPLALGLLALIGCAKPAPAPHAPDAAAAAPRPARRVTFVAVAEVRGTPEPCGCQSDPLGDVGRV